MTEQIYPEPTVGALILNNEGKILLVKTYKWKNQYIIPGGHVEVGETMEQALKREIKEETNLDISDLKFLCVKENIFGKEYHKKKHFIWLTFSCRANSDNVTLNGEAQDYKWVNPEEALKLPIDSYSRSLIEFYLKRKCQIQL